MEKAVGCRKRQVIYEFPVRCCVTEKFSVASIICCGCRICECMQLWNHLCLCVCVCLCGTATNDGENVGQTKHGFRLELSADVEWPQLHTLIQSNIVVMQIVRCARHFTFKPRMHRLAEQTDCAQANKRHNIRQAGHQGCARASL